MKHMKKVVPAALAFAVLASPAFGLKAEASTIISDKKENLSLNVTAGQMAASSSDVNKDFDADYINNNVIRANFPSATPPHIKQAKPLQYLYLDYNYTNGNKIIGEWRDKKYYEMTTSTLYYDLINAWGREVDSKYVKYFGSTYGEGFVKGLVLETLENFFNTRYAQNPNDPEVQKILNSPYNDKNNFVPYTPKVMGGFQGTPGIKRAILEEYGPKSLDELGIQVIWGDNNSDAEKAVTIGYSEKTPFNPLQDAVLTEKKYLKKVPGGASSIPGKNTGYEVSFDVKTGMTKEQSQSFAHTVGFNAGFGIKDILEIGTSYQFQSTFGTSLSVSEEQTVSRKFSLTNDSDQSITAALYQVTAEYNLEPGSVAAGIVNKTVNSPVAQFSSWNTATQVKVSSTSTGSIKTDDLKLIRSDVLEK
ncbi:hypothetical protein [Bacillus pseudomycoides]|uniref:hypothetical protein n=1 Tax=Bacillus pseudomycoides TaxID=64104 RepID=UPI001FB2F631|nr:hypothetical protein [Bacillus pseudomycoides]